MKAPTLISLPGLDGTGDLFGPFIAAAPPGFAVRALALPRDRVLTYEELAGWVQARLPDEDVVLVGESFSGPLAVLLAARCERVRGLVLSTTFVEPPLPRLLGHCPELIWRRPPPELVLQWALTGGDGALAAAVGRVMRTVPAAVVAARVAAVLRVDVGAQLRSLSCPVLCLRARADRLVGSRSASRIQALQPRVQLEHVDGPHLLLQARPAQVWSLLVPFLARIAARDQPNGGGPSPHSEE